MFSAKISFIFLFYQSVSNFLVWRACIGFFYRRSLQMCIENWLCSHLFHLFALGILQLSLSHISNTAKSRRPLCSSFLAIGNDLATDKLSYCRCLAFSSNILEIEGSVIQVLVILVARKLVSINDTKETSSESYDWFSTWFCWSFCSSSIMAWNMYLFFKFDLRMIFCFTILVLYVNQKFFKVSVM